MISPNQPVSWRIGTKQEILWSQSRLAGHRVVIELNRYGDNPVWEPLATVPAASGRYLWTVTGPASEGSIAQIRVSWEANPLLRDVSAHGFTILNRLTVVSPNTTVTWYVGSVQNIRFGHAIGKGQTVLVEAVRYNGTETIATVVTQASAGEQSVSWRVPPPIGTLRFQVTWLGGPEPLYDQSDADVIVANRPRRP